MSLSGASNSALTLTSAALTKYVSLSLTSAALTKYVASTLTSAALKNTLA